MQEAESALEEKRRKGREWYHANKEKRRKQARECYLRNREKNIERGKRRYRSDPRKFIAASLAWRNKEGNRDRFNANCRDYGKRNRKKISEYHHSWRLKNPDKAGNTDATRRARKRMATVALSSQEVEIIDAIYGCRRRVSHCLGVSFHVDHVIPLARGGKHIPSNLQLLPATINCRKHAKLQ